MKEERFFIVMLLMGIIATMSCIFLATEARAEIDLGKVEKLTALAFEKGEIDQVTPALFLRKIEKINEISEKHLYFRVELAENLAGEAEEDEEITEKDIVGFTYYEQKYTKNVIGGDTTILITQNVSHNGVVFFYSFALKYENGEVIGFDLHYLDSKQGEKWLARLLDEMIEEFE